ncbi:uncharacterized protein LOC121978365 [Zingiber officinale]|uniref:uncharacterized protein LOC121978365 n=1 Tax=Zingiber officinale TaxID=94328 RepID=UPI001C4CB6E2|nr:uncharacterized protein LOC121978365 [Zingiber officinale]
MAAGFLHFSLPALWARKRRRTERRRSSPPPSPVLSQDEEDCILGLLKLSRAPLAPHGGVQQPTEPKQQPALLTRSSPPPTIQQQEQSLLLSPALKQHRKKEPLPPPTPSTDDLRLYKCSECGRGFTSYQALGGHKSSHHRKRPAPSPPSEKQRHVKARRSIAMPSTSLME